MLNVDYFHEYEILGADSSLSAHGNAPRGVSSPIKNGEKPKTKNPLFGGFFVFGFRSSIQLRNGFTVQLSNNHTERYPSWVTPMRQGFLSEQAPLPQHLVCEDLLRAL
jgi:hypothetical protein